MLNKKEIKDIQSLAHKKFRKETGLFVAEGPKIVEELINVLPQNIEHLYASEEWATDNKSHTDRGHLPVSVIRHDELSRISQLTTPNQVLAVARQLPTAKPVCEGFILYLDAIQDPGNFGTIVRTADWFGIKQVVCGPGCADLYNPKVVQATMASIARVQVYYDEEDNWLSDTAAAVYAAVLDGSSLYSEPKATNGILLIGNESKGLRPGLAHLASKKITIPRRGQAESLNAAVATGIILSHLLG